MTTGVMWIVFFILVLHTSLVFGQLGVNVAGYRFGASCATKPEGSNTKSGCFGALDGSIMGTNDDTWMFFGEPLNSQFNITFNNTYELRFFRFMQPNIETEKNFKTIRLSLSDSSAFVANLTNNAGNYWDEFSLEAGHVTSFLHILVIEAYRSGPVTCGYVEIELYRELPLTTSSSDSTPSQTTSQVTSTLSSQSSPVSSTSSVSSMSSSDTTSVSSGHTSSTSLSTLSTSTGSQTSHSTTAHATALTTTSAATTSANSASTSASSASTSANSASTSASSASTSANSASAYTSSASTSANTASTSVRSTETRNGVTSEVSTTGGATQTNVAVVTPSAGASTSGDRFPDWLWVVVVIVVVIFLLQIILLIVFYFGFRKYNNKNVRVHPDLDQQQEPWTKRNGTIYMVEAGTGTTPTELSDDELFKDPVKPEAVCPVSRSIPTPQPDETPAVSDDEPSDAEPSYRSLDARPAASTADTGAITTTPVQCADYDTLPNSNHSASTASVKSASSGQGDNGSIGQTSATDSLNGNQDNDPILR